VKRDCHIWKKKLFEEKEEIEEKKESKMKSDGKFINFTYNSEK
jgi:hypothetical protein